MEQEVKWTESDYLKNYSKEWEKSVKITYWEHDIENGWYLIKFINANN